MTDRWHTVSMARPIVLGQPGR